MKNKKKRKPFIGGTEVSKKRAYKGLGDRRNWAANQERILAEMARPYPKKRRLAKSGVKK